MLKAKLYSIGTPEERAILAKAAILDIQPVIDALPHAPGARLDPRTLFPTLMPAFEHLWCEFSTGYPNGTSRRHERAVLGSSRWNGQAYLVRLTCFWNCSHPRLGYFDVEIAEQGGISKVWLDGCAASAVGARAADPATGSILHGAALIDQLLFETGMMVLEALALASAKRPQRAGGRHRGLPALRPPSPHRPASRVAQNPHIIVVSPTLVSVSSSASTHTAQGSCRRSVPYFRVGHWRQYRKGQQKRVWVRPHTCGSAQAGVQFRIQP